MELTPRLLTFPFELYCVCKAFLGDLIPKGEKCGSKQVSPKGGGMSSKRGKYGENQRGKIIDLVGGQTDIGWW